MPRTPHTHTTSVAVHTNLERAVHTTPATSTQGSDDSEASLSECPRRSVLRVLASFYFGSMYVGEVLYLLSMSAGTCDQSSRYGPSWMVVTPSIVR